MQERTLDFDCLVRVVQKAGRVALVELTNVRFYLRWLCRLHDPIFCVTSHDTKFLHAIGAMHAVVMRQPRYSGLVTDDLDEVTIVIGLSEYGHQVTIYESIVRSSAVAALVAEHVYESGDR